MAMEGVKSDVQTLSDDETVPEPGVAAVVPAAPKRKRLEDKKLNPGAVRGNLGRLMGSQCACARASKSSSCFKQFHGGGVDALFHLVWRLRGLDKQDMDNEACHRV